MSQPPTPPTRRDSQQQTREALVIAARAVFARDGYHKANLSVIAQEAGFSKGAVYSNFPHKAALFLAVMDLNIESALVQGPWDPFECRPPQEANEPELAEAIRGFALATLEFISVAARDHSLAQDLSDRLEQLTALYTKMAEEQRHDGDPLSAREIGVLLAALDQGTGLLTLTHSDVVPQHLLRAGMHRILDPSGTRTASTPDTTPGTHPEINAPAPGNETVHDAEGLHRGEGSNISAGSHISDAPPDGYGGEALHDVEIRRRISRSLRED